MLLYLLIASLSANVIILLVLLLRNPIQAMRESERALREESASNTQKLREELGQNNKSNLDSILKLTNGNEQRLEALRVTLEKQLKSLQSDNTQQLEKMRATVDEKLQSTLEKRLSQSFKLVSDRLEAVHKGLGDMQQLAVGVGDLKRVLTNVKTRGTWGEIQLGNLLEQVLTPEQYQANVQITPRSQERVDFAIRLPGNSDDQKEVWLPIDSKYPLEDYTKLLEAQEQADITQVEALSKQLEIRIKAMARDIRDKYIKPPQSTDFAIMFLPTESLYAEVLRRSGLAEGLQRDHRVVLTGPTTLAALLNSLQMGFKTLAIQKRSSEVWKILAKIRGDFSKFGDLLEKTQKKLGEASRSIEDAAKKSRHIENRLDKVQELPAQDDTPLKIIEQ